MRPRTVVLWIVAAALAAVVLAMLARSISVYREDAREASDPTDRIDRAIATRFPDATLRPLSTRSP